MLMTIIDFITASLAQSLSGFALLIVIVAYALYSNEPKGGK